MARGSYLLRQGYCTNSVARVRSAAQKPSGFEKHPALAGLEIWALVSPVALGRVIGALQMESMCEIRRLAMSDYNALIHLWRRTGLTHKPKGRDAREKIEQELDHNPHAFLGMFVDDRLVASVIATFDGRKGWINRVAVDPDFRGRGYGQQMIAEAEKTLREHFRVVCQMRVCALGGTILFFQARSPRRVNAAKPPQMSCVFRHLTGLATAGRA